MDAKAIAATPEAGREDLAGPVAWAAPAAWGAALVHLALGAGTLTASADSQFIGALLVGLGLAGLAWGATALARGRIVVPRAGVAGALVGLIAPAIALAADPGRTSVLAVAAADLLLVAVALACGWMLRAGARPIEARRARARLAEPVPAGVSRIDASETGGRVRITALLVSAFVVAAIVVPALGATDAGQHAPDHSEHELFFNPHHH